MTKNAEIPVEPRDLLTENRQLQQRIAELERTSAALRESEIRRSLLLSALPQKIFFKDSNLCFVAVNDAFAAEINVKPADLIGKSDLDLYPEDLAEKYRRDDRDVMSSRQSVTLIERHDVGGQRRIVEVTKAPVIDDNGVVVGLMGVFTDITERKQTEEALLHERHLLRTIMDNIPDSIYFKDAGSRFLRINRALADRFGLADPMSAVGQSDADYFSTEHAEQTRDDENRVMENGKPIVGHEEQEIWPDGRITWVSTTKMPLRNRIGQIIGTFGISRDITKRRLDEEAVRDGESRMRAILDSALDCIITLDHEGKINDFNPAAEKVFGYRSAAVLGKELTDLLDSGEGLTSPQRVERQLHDPYGSMLGTRVETLARKADGSTFPVEMAMTSVTVKNKPLFTVFLRDITERRRAERALRKQAKLLADQAEELERRNDQLGKAYGELKEAESQLIHSEKMAAVGQLVAGLAHEINNPVSFVLTSMAVVERDISDLLQYAEGCKELLSGQANLVASHDELRQQYGVDESAEEVRSLLTGAKRGMTRIRDLVANLRSFSRIDSRGDLGMGDLNDGIQATLVILKPIMKENVKVELHFGQIPLVECNVGQINQVVMNVIVNAVHAVKFNGVIKITTERSGDGAQIRIADNGPGIPANIRNRIFDPFFTTKPVGEGTGLGLSISKKLIEAHHGRLEFDSEVGQGAEFRIWLPLRQPQSEAADKE